MILYVDAEQIEQKIDKLFRWLYMRVNKILLFTLTDPYSSDAAND